MNDMRSFSLFIVVALIILLVLSHTLLFTTPVYAQGILVKTWVENVYDACGNPRVNPDDTYYPGDASKIRYEVTLGENVTFLKLEVSYDRSTFKTSTSGSVWVFEILKEAKPGNYEITFTAYGNHTYVSGNETKWEIISASSTQRVTIVKYEPHFTVLLNYTLYKDEHSIEYEKPFVIIVRYDGNGPDNNTRQRAIIDNYTYKITGIHINTTLNPNPTLKTTTSGTTTFTNIENLTTITVYKREYTNAKLLLWNKTCQLIFDNTRRYARLVLSSNDTLNIAKDGYEYVQTNVTFYTTRFSSQLYVDFNVTHVYMPNIFKKLMRVVAYEPYKVGDRIGFRIDENMRIKMMITPANASLTYPELLMMMAENEKSDETALQYFQNDLYNYKNATQIFDAMGELDAVINKTAVIDLYNYMIIIQNPNTNIETHDTTILLFDNETVNVYVNFIGYGVDVKNVTATPTQVIIRLFVRNEAGGLEWFAIRTQDEVLQNITLPRVPSLINARGFFGDHMITIPKTSSSYFYLEYKNVWNAVTLDGPYSIPQSNVERAEGLPFEYWVGLLFFAYVFARIVGRKLRRG
jgi:hypothetical protein